jgi:hypothetical protein
MAGPAGSRDLQPRRPGTQADDPIRRNAHSSERAQKSPAFLLLTLTYMDGNHPEHKTTARPTATHANGMVGIEGGSV